MADGAWYHAVTGKPFNEEVYIVGVRRRQAECERRRYWDDSSGTRQRRLLRSVRDAANRPRQRRAAMQLTLESFSRSVAELRHVINTVPHPQQTRDKFGGAGSDATTTRSGVDDLATLHGHAQDPVA